MTERCETVRDLAAGFVLGALTAEEDRLVRDHLATCREPHPEFAELGGVVGYLAEAVPQVEPPPALKARVLAAAAADLEQRTRRAGVRDVRRPPPATDAPVEVPVEPARRRFLAGTWPVAIAAVLAIAFLGGSILAFLNLQREQDAARTYDRGLAAVLDIALTPGGRTVVLAPLTGDGPSGLAAVGGDGRVAIVLRDLAPLSGSQVYEAWVVTADGAPVPIGDLRPEPGGAATLATAAAPAETAVTVALTREPGPGATVPTEPILAAGQVRPPTP